MRKHPSYALREFFARGTQKFNYRGLESVEVLSSLLISEECSIFRQLLGQGYFKRAAMNFTLSTSITVPSWTASVLLPASSQ